MFQMPGIVQPIDGLCSFDLDHLPAYTPLGAQKMGKNRYCMNPVALEKLIVGDSTMLLDNKEIAFPAAHKYWTNDLFGNATRMEIIGGGRIYERRKGVTGSDGKQIMGMNQALHMNYSHCAMNGAAPDMKHLEGAARMWTPRQAPHHSCSDWQLTALEPRTLQLDAK